MDPLTAFSLACGVIQVVDFSTKTLMKCRGIYQEGYFSDYQSIEDSMYHLVDVQEKLNIPNNPQSTGSPSTASDRSLIGLSRQCSETAGLLVAKLQALKIQVPHKEREALLKTVKHLWKKGEIDDIQKRLGEYRIALDTQILVSLRRQVDLASLQQSQDYQTLDQKVQNLISSVSQGSSSFEEVKDVILKENEKTRNQFSDSFQEHEKRVAEEEHRTKFLESLWFAEIHSREETIAEAHRKTFEWIFDRSGRTVRPWDNFNTWLENGEGTYWISGKAGSGKSTLMNFLAQDERTGEALKVWSGTKDIFMPRFFFWSSGTKIQRSLEGLLRSLLWQILNEFSDLSLPLFDTGARLNQNTKASNSNFIGAWTKGRLQTALKDIIRQLEASCCLCFFIDGLDEFEEDEDELIEFIRNLQSSKGVKVCSSSRSHRSFKDSYDLSAKLRLQDLTYDDIQQFVTDKFQEVPGFKSLTRNHETKMNDLKDKIVQKADGVFLWVSLAVKDQIRGLKNGDGPEMLQKRLALLPPEIEGVYSQMLHQIDPLYRQEASHFLRMALHRPSLSLREHALVSYKGLEDMLLSINDAPKHEIHLQCQDVQKRVLVTCAGLLEVRQPLHSDFESERRSEWSSETDTGQLQADSNDETLPYDTDSENVHNSDRAPEVKPPESSFIEYSRVADSRSETIDIESFGPEMNASVDFVHRTAVEFLESSLPGKEFLHANSLPEFDPQVSYVKALLGIMKMTMRSKDEEDLYGISHVDRVMSEVAYLEDVRGKPQTKLCELIDRTISIIDRKHPDHDPNSHWCNRWGKMARHYDLQDEIASTTTGSRPSSRDSFYSVESDSTAVSMTSHSFLGFAASHGLSEYVLEMLHLGQKSVSPEVLSYLLFCSVTLVGYSRGVFPDKEHSPKLLKLPPELLRRGANPNTIFLRKTIWTYFLERLFWTWNISHQLSSIFLFNLDIARCAGAFIEQAADVRSIWTFHYRSSVFAFDIQMSALSLIEAVTKNEANLYQVQQTAATRGAAKFSRCTILEVERATVESTGIWKQYELSEQESREIIETIEHVFKHEVEEGWRNLKDQITGLSLRIDRNRLKAPESSRTKIGLAQRSRELSHWSTFAFDFHPRTLGIKLFRPHNQRRSTDFFDALPSQPEPKYFQQLC